MKQNVLLHICCGICAAHSVIRLRKEDFRVTGFFYNPNIHPRQEYIRRLEVAHQVSRELDFELIEGKYEDTKWDMLTLGLHNEKEGAKRCGVCFRLRLSKTREKAEEMQIPFFTTTLTISPHKDSSVINRIGKAIGRQAYLEYDFKKKDGFKKTMEFSRTHNLYTQHYCGCVHSMADRHKEKVTECK
ncbi:MAG: epoxyqueuosine reductase QueH [bacterium]